MNNYNTGDFYIFLVQHLRHLVVKSDFSFNIYLLSHFVAPTTITVQKVCYLNKKRFLSDSTNYLTVCYCILISFPVFSLHVLSESIKCRDIKLDFGL